MDSIKDKKCYECKQNNSKLEFCKKCDAWLCSKHITSHLKTKICKNCKEELCEELFLTNPDSKELGWSPLVCFHCNTSDEISKVVKYTKNMAKNDRKKAEFIMDGVETIMKRIGYKFE